MGLLDQYAGQQAPQGGMMGAGMAQGGGLLGGGMGGTQAPAANNQRDLQMAQQLVQNPTPEMGKQIVAQMRQAGMKEADQIEAYLAQVGPDPAAIKQAAMQVVQALSAQ